MIPSFKVDYSEIAVVNRMNISISQGVYFYIIWLQGLIGDWILQVYISSMLTSRTENLHKASNVQIIPAWSVDTWNDPVFMNCDKNQQC